MFFPGFGLDRGGMRGLENEHQNGQKEYEKEKGKVALGHKMYRWFFCFVFFFLFLEAGWCRGQFLHTSTNPPARTILKAHFLKLAWRIRDFALAAFHRGL